MKSFRTQIAIVGAGPSGLATAESLQRAGWDVLVLEKGSIAQNIVRFPTYMTFFSTADLLELGGMPLTIAQEKPTRQHPSIGAFVGHRFVWFFGGAWLIRGTSEPEGRDQSELERMTMPRTTGLCIRESSQSVLNSRGALKIRLSSDPVRSFSARP